MLLGSAMFAYIVGNISEVVSVAGGQKDELKSRMRQLQEYINARKLPREVCIVYAFFSSSTRGWWPFTHLTSQPWLAFIQFERDSSKIRSIFVEEVMMGRYG
jgi:hypothetical protein